MCEQEPRCHFPTRSCPRYRVCRSCVYPSFLGLCVNGGAVRRCGQASCKWLRQRRMVCVRGARRRQPGWRASRHRSAIYLHPLPFSPSPPLPRNPAASLPAVPVVLPALHLFDASHPACCFYAFAAFLSPRELRAHPTGWRLARARKRVAHWSAALLPCLIGAACDTHGEHPRIHGAAASQPWPGPELLTRRLRERRCACPVHASAARYIFWCKHCQDRTSGTGGDWWCKRRRVDSAGAGSSSRGVAAACVVALVIVVFVT